jgi:hypothetical protein
LFAIIQNNMEVVAKHSKKCIPLAFFAMHQHTDQQLKLKQQQQQLLQQSNNQKQSVWEDVFEEITSGTEYAIRANLEEISQLIKTGLEHQSWNMRIQSAHCVCTIATKLQSHIDKTCLDELVKMLNASLSSRTWNGKVLLTLTSET